MKTLGKKIIPLLLFLAAIYLIRDWYFTPSVSYRDVATNFTATRLDGTEFSLSDLRGQYVLLDFWGSWCGPCRRESPELARLQAEFPDRLTVVSVAIERDSSAWQRALTRDGRNWPYQVMDHTPSLKFLSGEVSSRYGINAVPTTYFIGPAGQVQWLDQGAVDGERIRSVLNSN